MKLKNLIIAMFSALMFASCSARSNKTSDDCDSSAAGNPKAVVCYFSATGTTQAQAQRLAQMIGAPLFEIQPAEPYSDADLDWRDNESRSSVEMNDKESRPALGAEKIDMTEYDVVFIGYPNWWNTAPRIINTFIENNSLEGKTIVPFMTSGGSDITGSEKDLSSTYPTLTFAKGLLMNNVSDEEIIEWLKPLQIAL